MEVGIVMVLMTIAHAPGAGETPVIRAEVSRRSGMTILATKSLYKAAPSFAIAGAEGGSRGCERGGDGHACL
jgi:hypothetical protein